MSTVDERLSTIGGLVACGRNPLNFQFEGINLHTRNRHRVKSFSWHFCLEICFFCLGLWWVCVSAGASQRTVQSQHFIFWTVNVRPSNTSQPLSVSVKWSEGRLPNAHMFSCNLSSCPYPAGSESTWVAVTSLLPHTSYCYTVALGEWCAAKHKKKHITVIYLEMNCRETEKTQINAALKSLLHHYI